MLGKSGEVFFVEEVDNGDVSWKEIYQFESMNWEQNCPGLNGWE